MEKIIIAAYQGMGKSELVKKYKNCFELDSSSYDKSDPEWFKKYINDSIETLTKDNYTICFISTHPSVLDELKNRHDPNKFNYCIFYPSMESISKNEYSQRLARRYFSDPSIKNGNALANDVLYHNENITGLQNREHSISSPSGYIDLDLIHNMYRSTSDMEENKYIDYYKNCYVKYIVSKTDVEALKNNGRVYFNLKIGHAVIMDKESDDIVAVLVGSVGDAMLPNKQRRPILYCFGKGRGASVFKPLGDIFINKTWISNDEIVKIDNTRRKYIRELISKYPDRKELVDRLQSLTAYKIPEDMLYMYYQDMLNNEPKASDVDFSYINKGFEYTDKVYIGRNKVTFFDKHVYHRGNINGWFYHFKELYESIPETNDIELISVNLKGIEYHGHTPNFGKQRSINPKFNRYFPELDSFRYF